MIDVLVALLLALPPPQHGGGGPAPAAAAPAQSAPTSSAPQRKRILVLDLRNDGAKPEHARLVTDNIVVGLSRYPALEVLSQEDLRRVVATEGDRQAMGGCADDSCLVELAQAMDAQLVVHGSIGKLEQVTVVNLSLFDSRAGKSVAREMIQVQRLDDLPPRVEETTARLVKPLLGDVGATSAPGAQQSVPAPDVPKTNRVLAGSVAGVGACCIAGPLLLLVGALGFLPCVCVMAPVFGACGGGVAPFIGGAVSGAPVSSAILPAVIGAGVGAVTGLGVGVIVWVASSGVAAPDPTALGIASAIVTGAPVGLVTAATAGIATALLLSDPEPPAPQTSAREVAPPRERVAMAY